MATLMSADAQARNAAAKARAAAAAAAKKTTTTSTAPKKTTTTKTSTSTSASADAARRAALATAQREQAASAANAAAIAAAAARTNPVTTKTKTTATKGVAPAQSQAKASADAARADAFPISSGVAYEDNMANPSINTEKQSREDKLAQYKKQWGEAKTLNERIKIEREAASDMATWDTTSKLYGATSTLDWQTLPGEVDAQGRLVKYEKAGLHPPFGADTPDLLGTTLDQIENRTRKLHVGLRRSESRTSTGLRLEILRMTTTSPEIRRCRGHSDSRFRSR